jgi:type VI secretion system secreted protein VgrG
LSSLALAAGIVCLVLAVALAVPAGGSQATGLSAAIAPGLGAAASFAVLGGTTVTNTGPSVVTGDLGVSPGTEVTGFPPGIVNGTIHAGDALALQAQNDVIIAYNALASQPCDVDLSGQDLGGMTLVPGVYCFSTSAQLTGILTLDAEGDPLAVWVFQIGSTLTTGPGSSVAVIGGGDLCNVCWQVGSSATLDGTTAFAGNLLALQSISLNGGASVSGRILARNGAVTLINNNITVCVLQPTPTATATVAPTATATVAPTATATVVPTATATVVPTATATVVPTATATVAPTATAIVLPTATAIVLPTATAIVTATATAIVAPTETPIVLPTETPVAVPTETPVAVPTSTPRPQPTEAPPTETPIAAPTGTPLAPPTATPLSILPPTGVGPALLDSRQLLAAGLGFLGLGLVLSGFALRRKQGT